MLWEEQVQDQIAEWRAEVMSEFVEPSAAPMSAEEGQASERFQNWAQQCQARQMDESVAAGERG